MSVILHSATSEAMEVYLTRVEACFMRGFSGVQLIGNIGESCRAGVERAKAALEGLGHPLPQKKITLSLSPTYEKVNTSHFDLAMALALFILLQTKEPAIDLSRWILCAELGLDGRLRGVKNVVSFGVAALEGEMEGVIISEDNLPELNALQNLEIIRGRPLKVLAFRELVQITDWLESGILPRPTKPALKEASLPIADCFDDMLLTPELEELALTVAIGRHSLMMYGSPGTGKSMFSSRLISIFPVLDARTHLEALKIHSCYASPVDSNLIAGLAAYRSPHHQASVAAVLGIPETPGEISLAHGGVLFLDEFPEFRRDLIESLREPLETGVVRVSRAKKKVAWIARPILVAACNLCPCGWFGSRIKDCTCPTLKIINYRRKMSGPILDRIDLHINMEENNKNRAMIFHKQTQESRTKRMQNKVLAGLDFSKKRNECLHVRANADLKAQDLQQASGLNSATFDALVEKVMPKNLSHRSLIRTLRVARTFADLALCEVISAEDMQKALGYQADFAARARGDYAIGL